MLKLSLRDLRAHIGRYVLTFVAVAIGVAFVSGIGTLTDTVTRTFDDLFADVNAGTDAMVRGQGRFETQAFAGGQEQRPRIPADDVIQVIEDDVDGVAEVEPYVQGYTRLIDQEGDPVGNPDFGPPTFGMNWGEVDQLNPFDLVEGEAPTGPGEIVLDKASADSTGYEVGDTARFQSPHGSGEATVVGIAKFGTADSPFGASFVMFDLDTAEELLAEPGQVDGVGIVAADGVSPETLRDRVAEALDAAQITDPATDEPLDLDVVTGTELTEENQDDAAQSFQFITIFLNVFAAIAIVVGMFVIFTSFSFIVAQRQRQVALLRAVGASRRQVLGSVLIESTTVGLLASILGYLAGLGLAALLSGFMVEDGASLTVLPATVITALVVGTVITALSAFVPAWRSSRTPPVAAMLEAAIDTSGRSLRRLIFGGVILLVGVVALVGGISDGEMSIVGLGMLLVFVALVAFGPLAARPATVVMGGPVRRLKGVVGRLAQQNAARNPKRTGLTGSALMIGLGIVTLVLVADASLRKSLDSFVDDRIHGDFVVDAGTGFSGSGLPGEVTDEINDLPEVDAATGLRFGPAQVDGANVFLSGLDPETGFDLIDVGIAAGDPSNLDADGLAVYKPTAEDKGWEIGDEVEVTFGQTGTQTFTVEVLMATRDITDRYVVGTEAFDANVPTSGDSQILIRTADGVSAEQARDAIEGTIGDFPTAEVQNMEEYKDATKEQFNFLLIFFGVMLTLTIVIAMIGITNTMILSIVERTREIGLIRAVGASRAQIRSAIRWEALLISGFGLLAALGVGIFFGWVLVNGLEEEGFTAFAVPIGSLIAVTLMTAVLTLGAAVIPAAWAGRRNVLAAIATD
jgi:putative ABC transport system permease protein